MRCEASQPQSNFYAAGCLHQQELNFEQGMFPSPHLLTFKYAVFVFPVLCSNYRLLTSPSAYLPSENATSSPPPHLHPHRHPNNRSHPLQLLSGKEIRLPRYTIHRHHAQPRVPNERHPGPVAVAVVSASGRALPGSMWSPILPVGVLGEGSDLWDGEVVERAHARLGGG